MKKMIAMILSVLVLVACLVVARWAEGKNSVNPTDTSPDAKPTETITTAPTTKPTEQRPTEPPIPTANPSNPDDIENGLGWG